MRKLLFSISTVSLFSLGLNAQCTPDESLIDGAFGVYPDTIINFASATVNVPYTQVLHFKAPSDAGDVDPNFAGQTIQSFTVTGVTGMPPGLSYACNVSTCQYNGGSAGCATVSGTPTQVGTYEITIDIKAVVLVSLIPGFPPTPVNVEQSFSGYRIHVLPEGASSIEKLENRTFSLSPNPVKKELFVANLNQLSGVEIIQLFNIEGKQLQAHASQGADSVTLDTELLEAGVYFVQVQHQNGVERKKFIKE
jgi:hypothetical protein